MPDPKDPSPPRLGRVELLAAWLGMWTPPRGVVVPPVPWGKVIAAAAAVVTAIMAVVVLVVLPAAADRDAAQRRAQDAAARDHAAFLQSVDRDQRPHRAAGPRDPGRSAARRDRVAARSALVQSAGRVIRRDAAAATSKRILGVACEPFPRALRATKPTADLARSAAAYDCTAVTARFGDASAPGGAGIIGIPFRLVARFDAGRAAWCRVVPLSDQDRLELPLPRACRV